MSRPAGTSESMEPLSNSYHSRHFCVQRWFRDIGPCPIGSVAMITFMSWGGGAWRYHSRAKKQNVVEKRLSRKPRCSSDVAISIVSIGFFKFNVKYITENLPIDIC